MAWLDKNNKILTPVNYNVTLLDYNTLPNKSDSEVLSEVDSLSESLLDIWGDLRGWWLSGALNVTKTTRNAVRPHTNTDIIVLDNPELLEQMAERAKSLNLFPVRRTKSNVPFRRDGIFLPDIKEEEYILADPVKIATNRIKNRNYMFCAFDHDGKIVEEATPQSRVRLFVHYLDEKDETYFSIEDKLRVNPTMIDYQQKVGRISVLDDTNPEKHKLVLSSDIRYMLPIHRGALRRLRFARYRLFNLRHVDLRIKKHSQEIERIERYLENNPDYMRRKHRELNLT